DGQKATRDGEVPVIRGDLDHPADHAAFPPDLACCGPGSVSRPISSTPTFLRPIDFSTFADFSRYSKGSSLSASRDLSAPASKWSARVIFWPLSLTTLSTRRCPPSSTATRSSIWSLITFRAAGCG